MNKQHDFNDDLCTECKADVEVTYLHKPTNNWLCLKCYTATGEQAITYNQDKHEFEEVKDD